MFLCNLYDLHIRSSGMGPSNDRMDAAERRRPPQDALETLAYVLIVFSQDRYRTP